MTRRMKNLGSLAIGVMGMLGDIALCNMPNFMWEEARKEVAQIADINKDKITDASEWDSVYRELGSRYYIPNRLGEGRNLSISQLEEYISNHSNK